MIDRNSLFNRASEFSNISRAIFYRQTNFFSPIIFVEGGTEVLVFHKIVSDKCEVHFSFDIKEERGNKENVILTTKELNNMHVEGFIGLCDLDYDKILNKKQDHKNLLYTEQHDFETSFYVLDKLRNTFSNKFLSNHIPSLWNNLIDTLYKMGIIRLFHEDQKTEHPDFEKNFKDKLYSTSSLKLIIQQDFSVKLQDLTNHTFYHPNQIGSMNYNDYCQSINQLISKGYDKWEVIQGHDLENLLVMVIKKHSKAGIKSKTDSELLEEVQELLIKKAKSLFPQTKLQKIIEEWESNNPNFKILQ